MRADLTARRGVDLVQVLEVLPQMDFAAPVAEWSLQQPVGEFAAAADTPTRVTATWRLLLHGAYAEPLELHIEAVAQDTGTSVSASLPSAATGVREKLQLCLQQLEHRFVVLDLPTSIAQAAGCTTLSSPRFPLAEVQSGACRAALLRCFFKHSYVVVSLSDADTAAAAAAAETFSRFGRQLADAKEACRVPGLKPTG